VSVDGGRSWDEAELAPSTERWAWRRWKLPWHAAQGRYSISARAADETGRGQSNRSPWNRGGFANPTTQEVDVLVTSPGATS